MQFNPCGFSYKTVIFITFLFVGFKPTYTKLRQNCANIIRNTDAAYDAAYMNTILSRWCHKKEFI